MAVTGLGLQGTGNSKTAGTTFTIANTTGAIIPAGTFLHIVGCWDNIASVTAPTITCSTVGGATPTANHATAVGSGVTTTAGSGIWHQCFRVLTTASIAAGATIATLTSDQSAVVRCGHAEGWSGATTTLRGTVATGVSTTGAPSVASAGTALVAGDLVIGSASVENSALMTADADTLNGSWPPIIGTFTTSGNAQTNCATVSQFKIVTATGAQTFNPTGGVADTVACIYSVVPAVATTPATAALTATSTLTTDGTVIPVVVQSAAVDMTAVSDLLVIGVYEQPASVSMSATSTLTTDGTVTPAVFATVDMTATSTLTVVGTAGASGFDPSSITGLVSWYDAADASTFSYSSGVLVSQWRDKSAKGWHLAQASVPDQPSRSGTINGRSTVAFAGHVVDSGFSTLDVSAATVCFALRDTSTGNFIGLISAHATTGSDWDNNKAFSIATGVNRMFILEHQNTKAEYGTTELAGLAVRSAQRRPDGTHQVWNNGVPGVQDALATTVFGVANGGVLIGGRFLGGVIDPGLRMNGEVAEVLIYDRVLTASERWQVEGYLNTKWAISTSGYGSGLYGTGFYGGGTGPAVTSGVAALTATSTLTVSPTKFGTTAAAVAMTATSTLSTTGVRAAESTVAMTATSTLTTAPVVQQVAAVAMTATSTLTTAPVIQQVAAVAMTATSTLTTTALRTQIASVAMTATSTLTVAAIEQAIATVALTATSTLTVSAVTVGIQNVTAALTATSTLTTAGTISQQAAVAMSATSTLTVASVKTSQAAVALTATSTLTTTPTTLGVQTASVAMAASSTLTVVAFGVSVSSVALVGVATLTVASLRTQQAAVAMVAVATLTTTSVRTKPATVAFVGVATLTVTGVHVYVSAVSLTAFSTLFATTVVIKKDSTSRNFLMFI